MLDFENNAMVPYVCFFRENDAIVIKNDVFEQYVTIGKIEELKQCVLL